MLDPTQFPEYDAHHEVVEVHNPVIGLTGFIAIHRLNNGFPSLGATRWREYPTEAAALRDALRLARLMTSKSQAVGLPYGGAKGVLVSTPLALQHRTEVLEEYAAKVTTLQGRFITGSDMGIVDDDLHIMKKITPFVIGEGVPAAYWTAWGVVYALQTVLENLYHSKTLLGHSFAIQGLGKTGRELLKLLYHEGLTRIYITDTDERLAQHIQKKFPRTILVPPHAIYEQEVDVFCPCGGGAVLNLDTVFRLRCRAIVGSSNNQLASPEIVAVLKERGIIYAPDFIVNAGGLLSVVDHFTHDRVYQPARVKKVLWRIPEVLKNFLGTPQFSQI